MKTLRYIMLLFDFVQMERYKELKELARKKGAILNQSAEKLHWEIKADREKLQFDLRRKSEIQVGFCLYVSVFLRYCDIQ